VPQDNGVLAAVRRVDALHIAEAGGEARDGLDLFGGAARGSAGRDPGR
jgi:hypothetical protein